MDSASSITRSLSSTIASDPQVAKAQARTGEKLRENYEFRRSAGREIIKEQRNEARAERAQVVISKAAVAAQRAEAAQKSVRADAKANEAAVLARAENLKRADEAQVQRVAAKKSDERVQAAARTRDSTQFQLQKSAEIQREDQQEVAQVLEQTRSVRRQQELEKAYGDTYAPKKV